MPELRDKKVNFKPLGPKVDIYTIKFKDNACKKTRQKRLAANLAGGGKIQSKSRQSSVLQKG
eukprot:11428165-Ditylum_brightwellii.AAC.1